MPLSHPPISPSNISYCVKLQLDLPKSHYYTKDYLGTNPTKQQYKFGGKELITTNGLNEYDFGARNYYPSVPAFTRIDPMAEKCPWLSPYLYCANNPVNLVDPTGMDSWTLDSTGHLLNYMQTDKYDEIIVINMKNDDVNIWKGEYGSISKQSNIKSIDENGDSIFIVNNVENGKAIFYTDYDANSKAEDFLSTYSDMW